MLPKVAVNCIERNKKTHGHHVDIYPSRGLPGGEFR